MAHLDDFYSENPISDWEEFFGGKMHYHFGIPNNNNIDPFDQAVFNLFPYIPKNSRLLDCGCGWGEPSKLIKKYLNCSVTGVTISKSQAAYIKDFRVVHSDLHDFKPDEQYDVALFLESYTHLENPKKVLKNIKDNVKAIIIKDYISETYTEFPEWHMNIRSKKKFYEELNSAGFEIKEFKVHYNFFQPSLDIWMQRIENMPAEKVNRQIQLLYKLCIVLKSVINSQHYDLQQCTIYATKMN